MVEFQYPPLSQRRKINASNKLRIHLKYLKRKYNSHGKLKRGSYRQQPSISWKAEKQGKFNETKDFEIINKIDKVLRRLIRKTKIK